MEQGKFFAIYSTTGRGFPTRTRSRRKGALVLEIAPAPAHPHDRAPLRNRPVLEGQRRARAFEQGLGDEESEAQPAARLAAEVHPPPPRAADVGLANAV